MKKVIFILLCLFSLSLYANPTQKRVRVKGMTCPSCAASVEKELMKMSSVKKIEISLTNGIVVVFLKEGKTILRSEIQSAVENAGFTVLAIN
ncbi:MAG: heavy-metal-associated domain-containing protein [Bdellovibrionales bacterium]|nr:heavy-metal-associated domain-containing protein [Bdellovibrionales bacterium]